MRFVTRLMCAALVLSSCSYQARRLLEETDADTTSLKRHATITGGDNVPNPNDCDEIKLEVDPDTAAVCTRCYRAGEAAAPPNCDDPNAECRHLDQDGTRCLICTYGGSVVLNDCPTQQGTCTSGIDVNGNSCETCYDAGGNVLSSTCALDCSDIACVSLACPAAQAEVLLPGECCATCSGELDCSNVECPYSPVPVCEEGELRRSPTDCCTWFCEQTSCTGVVCPEVERSCPTGTYPDDAVPPCCSACVAYPEEPVSCVSSDDCVVAGVPSRWVCERGTCGPVGYICPAATAAPLEPCEGVWTEVPDPFGCPGRWACLCGDGSEAIDGQCAAQCTPLIDCPLMECLPNFVLVTPLGECCPRCVESPNCEAPPATCFDEAQCSPGEVCESGHCAVAVEGGFIFKKGTDQVCMSSACQSALGWYVEYYSSGCCPTCLVTCGSQTCGGDSCSCPSCNPKEASCYDLACICSVLL